MTSIDIIIPIFNLSLYRDSFNLLYKKLINSSLSTLILVNDGSTDDTSQILKNFYEQNPSRVCLIEYTINQGQGYARNVGFKASTADYILFLDADDQISSSSYISVSNKILNSDPSDILFLPFASRPLNSALLDFSNGRKYIMDSIMPSDPEERIRLFLLDRITVSPCNKIVSASLLRSIETTYCSEIFPPNISCEDIIYSYRLLKAAKTINISSISDYYIYQIRQGSTMVSVSPRTYNILEVFRIIRTDIKNTYLAQSMAKELKSFFIRECIINVQRKLCLAKKFSKQQLFAYCSALETELQRNCGDMRFNLLFTFLFLNKYVLFLFSMLITFFYTFFRRREKWI